MIDEHVAIFTLGLSPPIATEFLLGLKERGVGVIKAIAVTTEGALPSFHALKIAFHWSSRIEGFPHLADKLLVGDFSSVDLRLKRLGLGDIAKPEDCRSFRAQFDGAVNDALRWAGGIARHVHVCVAGGRKTMPVDATLISVAEGLRNVYHVIAPRIPGISTEFAKMVAKESKTDEERELLGRLEEFSERPERAPEDTVEYALELCFPPRDLEFYLIRMPIPRLSREERMRFREELR